MSVAEMQACLARLYVDEMFRELFRADHAIARRHYEITDEELGAVAAIDGDGVDLFVKTLAAKRRKRLASKYPGVFQLEPKGEIDRFFRRYCQLHLVHRPGDSQTDTLQLGTFMEETLPTSELLPPYAGELARFERVENAVRSEPAVHEPERRDPPPVELGSRPTRRPGVAAEWFSFDVVGIREAIGAGTPPPNAPEPEYGLVFQALGRTEPIRLLRLNRATMVLLELCDGRRTVASIIETAEGVLGATGLEDKARAAFQHLVNVNVVTV